MARMQVVQVSEFAITCPKWALPQEEIPIHVKINKGTMHKIECVRISLDERLSLVDRINISDYDEGPPITIKEIEKSARSDYDYFGIVVATKTNPDDLKTQIPIPIEIVYRDGTHDLHFAHARIFRPRVEFDSIPESIVLSGGQDELVIPVGLKFLGFGEISLRAECKIGGRIISEGSSLLDETLRRMLIGGMISTEDRNQAVSINRKYVEDMVEEVKGEIQSDKIQRMIQEGSVDQETRDSIYNMIKNDGQNMADAVYRTVEAHLSQIVSEILGRHLGANSRLESPTRIRYSHPTQFEHKTGGNPASNDRASPIRLRHTNVQVLFFYKDRMDNEYDPIEKTISIVDKRTATASPEVVIPIQVNVDESGAYGNVQDMNIGP